MIIPLFLLQAVHTTSAIAQAGAGTLPEIGWTMPTTLEIVQVGCFGPIKLTGLSLDGATVKNGRADLVCNPSASPMHGKVTGSFSGNYLRLTIDWGCVQRPWPLECRKTVGIYEGDVKNDGMIEGTTFDQSEPGSRAIWRTAQPLQHQ